MRARNIKPEFFIDEDVGECSFAARLLFVGLWCVADCEGRFEWRPKRLKVQIFPHDADVDVPALLAELQANSLLDHYEADGRQYGVLPGFTKHQNPHKKEREQGAKCPEPVAKMAKRPGHSRATPGQDPVIPGQDPVYTGSTPGNSGANPADSGFRDPDSGILIPDLNTEVVHQGDAPAGESPPAPPPQDIDSFVATWNTAAKDAGWPTIRAMTGKRKRTLKARLAEPEWRQMWQEALETARGSPFLRGQSNSGWRMNIDFFLRPDSVTRIVEGAYSDGRQTAQSTYEYSNPNAPW